LALLTGSSCSAAAGAGEGRDEGFADRVVREMGMVTSVCGCLRVEGEESLVFDGAAGEGEGGGVHAMSVSGSIGGRGDEISLVVVDMAMI
jgi:hypothetical protein